MGKSRDVSAYQDEEDIDQRYSAESFYNQKQNFEEESIENQNNEETLDYNKNYFDSRVGDMECSQEINF